jgi:hypothetical protein
MTMKNAFLILTVVVLPVLGIALVTLTSVYSGYLTLQEKKLIMEYGTPTEKAEVLKTVIQNYKKHEAQYETMQEGLRAAMK